MEKDYFVSGDKVTVVDINGFRVAPVICYDLRFPEIFRRLSIGESADVILHPVSSSVSAPLPALATNPL